jgi:hypothetical protein
LSANAYLGLLAAAPVTYHHHLASLNLIKQLIEEEQCLLHLYEWQLTLKLKILPHLAI